MPNRVASAIHTPLNYAFRTGRPGSLVLSLTLLLLCAASAANADTGKVQSATRACSFSDAEFDPATDLHAIDEYRNAVARLLKDEKFTELNCIADAAREGKTRFSGGDWKLHNIYVGLDEPGPGHPTQQDWQKHLELVEKWRKLNPQSITAQIAQARSYVSYAWDARGFGYSD